MNIHSNSRESDTNPMPIQYQLHQSPRQTTSIVDIDTDAMKPLETTGPSSFSERIGSFVGTCSRNSLMYMAENENVVSPSDKTHPTDTMDDRISIGSSSLYKRNSIHDERTSLLRDHPPLTRLPSNQSRTSTIADAYQDSSGGRRQQGHIKSNFIQSVFNSINILAGVGILALPLGFKHAGWIMGMTTFCFCLGLTNYTAKLLGRCLQAYPESFTYGDIAYNAFGNSGRIVVSVLFLTELITCSVALVVLLTDGLDSLFPGRHSLLMTILSFIILTPMLFFPVRHLAYTSLIGIISAICIIVVMIIDGFTKSTSPGSLIESADTTWWPENWMALPKSTGLIMAGFCGHACFGSILRDMQNPKQYTKMVDWTYLIAGSIYLTVAVAGYRMFGSDTMQEVTQNLLLIPEYNRMLNRMAVWLIALNPIAKYALTMNPVNLSWELALERQPSIEAWYSKQPWRGQAINIVGKCLVSALIVLLAYLIPAFDRIMSLLGACFSFIICGMFPIICYHTLFGPTLVFGEKVILWILFFLCFVLATVGTLWSFI